MSAQETQRQILQWKKKAWFAHITAKGKIHAEEPEYISQALVRSPRIKARPGDPLAVPKPDT